MVHCWRHSGSKGSVHCWVKTRHVSGTGAVLIAGEASEAGILSGAGGVLIAETMAEAGEAAVVGEALISGQASKVSVVEATAVKGH